MSSQRLIAAFVVHKYRLSRSGIVLYKATFCTFDALSSWVLMWVHSKHVVRINCRYRSKGMDQSRQRMQCARTSQHAKAPPPAACGKYVVRLDSYGRNSKICTLLAISHSFRAGSENWVSIPIAHVGAFPLSCVDKMCISLVGTTDEKCAEFPIHHLHATRAYSILTHETPTS